MPGLEFGNLSSSDIFSGGSLLDGLDMDLSFGSNNSNSTLSAIGDSIGLLSGNSSSASSSGLGDFFSKAWNGIKKVGSWLGIGKKETSDSDDKSSSWLGKLFDGAGGGLLNILGSVISGKKVDWKGVIGGVLGSLLTGKTNIFKKDSGMDNFMSSPLMSILGQALPFILPMLFGKNKNDGKNDVNNPLNSSESLALQKHRLALEKRQLEHNMAMDRRQQMHQIRMDQAMLRQGQMASFGPPASRFSPLARPNSPAGGLNIRFAQPNIGNNPLRQVNQFTRMNNPVRFN